MRDLLTTVKQITPAFPANSYIFATNPPYGRTFLMQGLRAFYKDPDMKWISDLSYSPQPGQRAFLINFDPVLTVIPFSDSLGNILRRGQREGWLGPLPGVLD
ncbi:hypothetical protein GMSM_11620 [Geomonas sp. Red276]